MNHINHMENLEVAEVAPARPDAKRMRINEKVPRPIDPSSCRTLNADISYFLRKVYNER